MDNVVNTLIAVMLQGGPEVVAVLILFIILLLLDRKRLLNMIDRKDEKIDDIIDDYHSGNITLAEAMNSLKLVLYELKAKIN